MPSFEEIQKARILNSFNTDEGLSELTKAEILDIEKGGKRAMIGEKRTFAGREYIKTSDGWKFHGKGTGSKAQSHVAGALEHRVDSDVAIRDHAKEIAEDAGMKVDEFEKLNSETKKELWGQYKKNNPEESHKDATDHFVEEDGKHYIDSLDPDSGEKKFKPGDKVKYQDNSGKQHKGTLSDREHPDGDMFEVDREGDIDPKTITDKQFSSESEKNAGEASTKKLHSKTTRNDIVRGATITYKGEQVKVVSINPETDRVLLDNGENVHMGQILLDREKK